MYVDGILRGVLQAPRAFFHVDGGDPMNITSDIVLCGRADHAPGRTFKGKISQLAFFNDALSSFQARYSALAYPSSLFCPHLACPASRVYESKILLCGMRRTPVCSKEHCMFLTAASRKK